LPGRAARWKRCIQSFSSMRCASRFAATESSATRRCTWLLASRPTVSVMYWACGLSRPKVPKFWLKVFNELKTRGVQDILIAVVDGLKGLAEAINTAYPKTAVQTWIVYLIRNSLDYAGFTTAKR